MKIWIDPKEWQSSRKGTLVLSIVGLAMAAIGAAIGVSMEVTVRSAMPHLLIWGGMYFFGAAVGMSFWLIPPLHGTRRSRYMKYTDDND